MVGELLSRVAQGCGSGKISRGQSSQTPDFERCISCSPFPPVDRIPTQRLGEESGSKAPHSTDGLCSKLFFMLSSDILGSEFHETTSTHFELAVVSRVFHLHRHQPASCYCNDCGRKRVGGIERSADVLRRNCRNRGHTRKTQRMLRRCSRTARAGCRGNAIPKKCPPRGRVHG